AADTHGSAPLWLPLPHQWPPTHRLRHVWNDMAVTGPLPALAHALPSRLPPAAGHDEHGTHEAVHCLSVLPARPAPPPAWQNPVHHSRPPPCDQAAEGTVSAGG